MEPGRKESQLSLLLVEDDGELCSMMKEFFDEMGFHLDCVHNGRDGLARALKSSYDLIIADVMLPIMDGFTLLQQIRRRKKVPVIMLTARVQRQDRILGLNAGADDYLPKPFDPDELLARVRAVLRRTGRLEYDPASLADVGDLQVNLQTREVWRSHQMVELTSLEFDILAMLIRAAGRIVTRHEITASLFEREPTPYDRALDVHISHLRRKLADVGARIRTVRGVGYVLAAGSGSKL